MKKLVVKRIPIILLIVFIILIISLMVLNIILDYKYEEYSNDIIESQANYEQKEKVKDQKLKARDDAKLTYSNSEYYRADEKYKQANLEYITAIHSYNSAIDKQNKYINFYSSCKPIVFVGLITNILISIVLIIIIFYFNIGGIKNNMGKTLKEFFSSPKKTAILGLIGAIISILYYIIIQQIDYNYLDYFDFGILVYFILYNISIIGLIVYFSIVLMRITKKTGNIQVANILLIVSFVIQTIFSIFRMYGGVITTILYIIIIIYLCSILLKTKKTISNKIFIISPIGFILLSLYGGFESGSMIYKASQAMSIFNIGDTITSYWNVIKYMLSYSFYYISYLFMIPYFYNYYNLLKGGNKNGK